MSAGIEFSLSDFPDELQVMVDKIGMDNTQRLVNTFAGSSVYFPRIKVRREAVKRHIMKYIKEKPIATIAREAGVTSRTVYRYMHKLTPGQPERQENNGTEDQ